MARPEWIEVGRVSRAHGVEGEVRVMPDSDNPERFAPGSVLHARPGRSGAGAPRLREQVRLTVRAVRGGEDFPIVAFREIADRDSAEALSGYLLEVRSGDLPVLAEDEYYPFDLQGLEARDPQGTVIGRVTEVIECPAHPVLGLTLVSGREALVPFVSAAVPTVAIAEGYLVIEKGFVDLEADDPDRS